MTSRSERPGFEVALREHFPRAMPLDDFSDRTVETLEPYEFRPENTLLLLGTCRDELSTPVFVSMQWRWGAAFGIAGLAGMLYLGRMGMTSARRHIPDVDGIERFVTVVTTHIGIHEDGTLGQYQRTGQTEPSNACTALVAFHRELYSGKIYTQMDPDDTEMSLLRLRMLRSMRWGHVPSILELTRTARSVILSDYERLVQPRGEADERTRTATISGIVIHGPDGDYIEPAESWLRLGSHQQELTI